MQRVHFDNEGKDSLIQKTFNRNARSVMDQNSTIDY